MEKRKATEALSQADCEGDGAEWSGIEESEVGSGADDIEDQIQPQDQI